MQPVSASSKSVGALLATNILTTGTNRCPDRVALRCEDQELTHGEVTDRVGRLLAVLRRELGLCAGDRFAVMATSGIRYVELWHAAALGGGALTPLNARAPMLEIALILADAQPKVVFAETQYLGLIEDATTEAKGAWTIVVLDAEAEENVCYEDLVRGSEPYFPSDTSEQDLCLLLYTGGTTGRAKGVAIDHRAMAIHLHHLRIAFGIDENFAWMALTPLYHIAGSISVYGAFLAGGSATILPTFDPADVIKTVERRQITHTGAVSTMLALLLEHSEFRPDRLASLRKILYGAGPTPGPLLRKARALLPNARFIHAYGMTESCGAITSLELDDDTSDIDGRVSVGHPIPGVSIAIGGETGAVLAPHNVGEVLVRCPSMMTCYWNDRAATDAAFMGGWYHTGDAGFLDEAGRLFLVDRVKDMIISGGENVYSVEVENALSEHPAVREVAVIGTPDATWGEAVHAIVVRSSPVSADDLKDFLRPRIAGYKIPKVFTFRDDPLPLSPVGKVMKAVLRDDVLHPTELQAGR